MKYVLLCAVAGTVTFLLLAALPAACEVPTESGVLPPSYLLYERTQRVRERVASEKKEEPLLQPDRPAFTYGRPQKTEENTLNQGLPDSKTPASTPSSFENLGNVIEDAKNKGLSPEELSWKLYEMQSGEGEEAAQKNNAHGGRSQESLKGGDVPYYMRGVQKSEKKNNIRAIPRAVQMPGTLEEIDCTTTKGAPLPRGVSTRGYPKTEEKNGKRITTHANGTVITCDITPTVTRRGYGR